MAETSPWRSRASFNYADAKPGPYERIGGVDHLDKVIEDHPGPDRSYTVESGDLHRVVPTTSAMSLPRRLEAKMGYGPGDSALREGRALRRMPRLWQEARPDALSARHLGHVWAECGGTPPGDPADPVPASPLPTCLMYRRPLVPSGSPSPDTTQAADAKRMWDWTT